jgi:hypothetical protein
MFLNMFAMQMFPILMAISCLTIDEGLYVEKGDVKNVNSVNKLEKE